MKIILFSLLLSFSSIISYSQPGSPNTAFGGGAVITPFGTDDQAAAIAVQPDGKILLAGTVYIAGERRPGIVRYNADGSLDIGFATGGKLVASNTDADAIAILIQPDGKIILGGSVYTTGTGEDFYVRDQV